MNTQYTVMKDSVCCRKEVGKNGKTMQNAEPEKTWPDYSDEVKVLLKEREETTAGIENTIRENGFIRFPNELDLFGYGRNGELNRRYQCYTPNLLQILKKNKDDIAIVSGYGATNSPTVGTLSQMKNAIMLQRETGIKTYQIINDLGSLNARNIDPNRVFDLAHKMKKFLIKLGFDMTNGEIRTHNNADHHRISSIVSSVVKLDDFVSNGEATDGTYERMNLKGNDFSVLVDHAFTAADVLLPVLRDRKTGIIVPCGLEEYYHANIGGTALERLKKDERWKDLIPDDVQIGAIYTKLIRGFYPYFKQSKSIPESSVNLGDSFDQIYKKIVGASGENEEVVLDMIRLCSDYSESRIQEAVAAYESKDSNYSLWEAEKKAYADYFSDMKRIWDSCGDENIPLRKKIFMYAEV